MTDTHYDKALFERAKTMLKVQGIISIIFGAFAVLIGLGVIATWLLGLVLNTGVDDSPLLTFILVAIVLIVVVLPHVYLTLAGILLVRHPRPGIALALTIINLVLGIFSNWIIMIFAIISLTHHNDYKRYYNTLKK